MIDKIACKRYAESFVNFAKESVGTEKIVAELNKINSLIESHADLKLFLRNPEIPSEVKHGVIIKILSTDFSRCAQECLELLIEKRRVDHLPGIVDFAKTFSLQERKTEIVTVRTAKLLNPKLANEIKLKLESRLNKKLQLEVAVDENLIAGAEVTIGHTIIDGSVRRHLEDLREKLLAVTVG